MACVNRYRKRNIDAVLDARRRHGNGEMTQAELNRRITAAGYCPTPNGLLADRELRAVIDCYTACKYDFMHVAFQDGFASHAMWLVVQVGLDDITQGGPLVVFIKSFQFPFSRSRDRHALSNVFCAKMMRKHSNADVIVGNASVQLSLYRMLEFWAIEKSSPEMDPHNEVFFAACYVANLFLEVKHRRMETRTAAELLLPAIERWQTLHKALYGSQHFKPKFNWIWSVAEQLAASPFLFDMFCVERQHRRVKRQVELVRNTTDFERSSLMRVLDSQITSLRNPVPNNCLRGRSVPCVVGGRHALMADSLTMDLLVIHCDDLVLSEIDGRVGVVLSCLKFVNNDDLHLEVEVMEHIHRTHYRQTAACGLWLAGEVRLMFAWRQRLDDDRGFDVI